MRGLEQHWGIKGGLVHLGPTGLPLSMSGKCELGHDMAMQQDLDIVGPWWMTQMSMCT